MERDGADLEAHLLSTDDSDARSMHVESADNGHDEILAIVSQVKDYKARVLSNLTEQEQEEVALFLERNDFIYNKRQTDHTSVSKKNKAWDDLAQEMGKDVKALITFFESILTQIGVDVVCGLWHSKHPLLTRAPPSYT